MKILLHICCAVCATSCVERLRQEGYEVCGYFYNPNIQPRQEYLRRLQEVQRLSRAEKFSLIVGDYDLPEWSLRIQGLELEPEGGKRCAECFRLRLESAAKLAREKGYSCFTTTLTVSPHKSAQTINEIGRSVSEDLFLARDFKKRDGFKRAQELSREHALYHQDYCGCIYSLNKVKTNRA